MVNPIFYLAVVILEAITFGLAVSILTALTLTVLMSSILTVKA